MVKSLDFANKLGGLAAVHWGYLHLRPARRLAGSHGRKRWDESDPVPLAHIDREVFDALSTRWTP
jgi:hypothetical protein